MMDRDAIARDWQARGFGCDLWTDPPGQVWADFVHTTDELVMLVEGEIELHFADQVLRPAVGEEVLIPANTPHTVINVGAKRNRWLYGYAKR